jgi:hypothetical protein
MAEKEMPEDPDMPKQYTEDDPEYWALMARIIGNPVPDYEDDSDEVDENGVYRGKPE